MHPMLLRVSISIRCVTQRFYQELLATRVFSLLMVDGDVTVVLCRGDHALNEAPRARVEKAPSVASLDTKQQAGTGRDLLVHLVAKAHPAPQE
mmetsp:Transcript_16448/g.37755  ORF Transcript_16448/g.37755 Transcript_16448/m.37755 type:complete len:93 (+) Transcript_16448:54-332(+)